MKSMRKTIIASLPLLLLFSMFSIASSNDGNTAEISLSPDLPEGNPAHFNQTFTVSIIVKADEVRVVQCRIRFNQTVLKAIEVENGEMYPDAQFFIKPGIGIDSPTGIDNDNGLVGDITGFTYSPINASNGLIFANITFQVITNESLITPIEFVTNFCFVDEYETLTYNTTIKVNPVEIRIEPKQALLGNYETTFYVNVTPGVNEITTLNYTISFDPQYLEIIDVENGNLFPLLVNTTKDGQLIIINSFYNLTQGTNDNGTLALITLKPKQTGYTSINITGATIIDVDRQETIYILQNAAIEIDLDYPVVTFEYGTPHYNGSNWITSSTPIYINATDAHDYTIYYRIWNGTWTAWQSGLLNTNMLLHVQDEGKHYIEYYAKDKYNNTSPVGNETFYVDNTPPVSTLSLTPSSPDGENGWYVGDVTINFTAVDAGSGVMAIRYKIDDGNVTDYTGEFTMPEGEHTIYFYAVDNLGNKEGMKEQNIKIDKTMPNISYAKSGTMGTNGWYKSTVTITLNATDTPSGIQEFKYKKDGSWQDYTQPFTLNDGIYNIKYYAKDMAGNNVSGELNISVDTTKPTATHTLQGTLEEGKYTTDVTIKLSAYDNLAGVKEIHYKLDGGNWQIFPGVSGTDTVSAEGTHTIEYYAVDNAGNAGVHHQATFTIEKNKKPVADFTYTPENPTDVDTINFVDHSSDEDGEVVSWFWEFGDGNTSSKQNPTHKYADNGTYVVKLTVKDDKNATSTKQVAIVVTNKAPVAKFTYQPDKPKIGDEIQFTSQSFDDDGNIVSYAWDFGDGNTSTEQNPVHSYEKKGTYNVTLTVTDNDGATHQETQQVVVTKEEVNIWLYLIIILILIIVAVVVVAVWKKRTKTS